MAAGPGFPSGFRPFRCCVANGVGRESSWPAPKQTPLPSLLNTSSAFTLRFTGYWEPLHRPAAPPRSIRLGHGRRMLVWTAQLARGFLNVGTTATGWSLARDWPAFATGANFVGEVRGVGIECRKLPFFFRSALAWENYSVLSAQESTGCC